MRREFIDAVITEVQKLMPDMEVTVQEVLKNNDGLLHGVLIKSPTSNVTPAIYLENYLTNGREPNDIREVAKKIVDIYLKEQHNTDEVKDIVSKLYEFDSAKPYLRIRLVNKELNTNYLADIPHMDFLDMAIIVVFELGETDAGMATVKLTQKFLEQWNVTFSDILPFAHDNTFNTPYVLKSMAEIMAEMFGMPLEMIEAMENSDSPMYVLSNKDNMYGAVRICNYETMKEIANKLNADLVVLPSSVHEVIIVPKRDGMSVDDMTAMVQSVNSSEVAPDEVLSNHAYVFTRENGWER